MCSLERFNLVADLFVELGDRLSIPDGHRYCFDRSSSRRWAVDHQERYGSDISAFISRSPGDELDPRQISVEIRIFLDTPRAILFVKQGVRLNFMAKTLFADPAADPLVYADNYPTLFEEVESRINQALNSAV